MIFGHSMKVEHLVSPMNLLMITGIFPPDIGGPATYVQFGPWDHKGYKGDFLTIRELRGGELRFDGYHRPEWPSNAAG